MKKILIFTTLSILLFVSVSSAGSLCCKDRFKLTGIPTLRFNFKADYQIKTFTWLEELEKCGTWSVGPRDEKGDELARQKIYSGEELCDQTCDPRHPSIKELEKWEKKMKSKPEVKMIPQSKNPGKSIDF